MNIEEAWEDVDDAAGCAGCGYTLCRHKRMAAARALALAVLEETATGWHANPVNHLQAAAAHYDAVRRRIEALS